MATAMPSSRWTSTELIELKLIVSSIRNSYETSDGISRQETAQLKHAGTAEEAIAVQGSVKWVGPDGVHYKLNYLADENGFQPEGEHLPRQETSGML